jgi:hypothetical protein
MVDLQRAEPYAEVRPSEAVLDRKAGLLDLLDGKWFAARAGSEAGLEAP